MSAARYEKLERPECEDDFTDSDEEKGAERTSDDVRRHDHETLTAEEEAERLLIGGEKSSERQEDSRKQRRKDGRKQSKKRRKGEDSELMYKMEEGGPRSSSEESSGRSSEVDMHRLGEIQSRQKSSRVRRCCGLTAIYLIIVVAFLGILYGAYQATRASHVRTKAEPIAKSLSNGTHIFGPTTILISLDGFRADFLQRGLTPTLNSFIRKGVSPKHMLPSFPSLTFPNHYTLVTGMYPESHGIVGNTFWDPVVQKEFYYTDPARSMQSEWWDAAEPLWLTAELAGVKTAIHMWPGSEAHIGSMEPAYVDEFNEDEDLANKVARIFQWLDRPGPEDTGASESEPRPQLIAAYVPNVDADGHKYGPNSTYIRSTIREVDGMLGNLFGGISERNLTNIVNIIVVSDHGMATTSTKRMIQLEDIVDVKEIAHVDGWPLYGLRPTDDSEANIKKIHDGLVAMSGLPKYRGAFDVYLRDKDMPKRYHFSNNARIAPIWVVPRTGWAIVPMEEFNVAKALKSGEVYSPRGLHGYDFEHPLMRAIFVARGPAFPHPEGSKVHVFQNTEVYNIVCDSLGIEPNPNNGTLRLPLAPVGKHIFDDAVEIPEDPQDEPADEDSELTVAPNLNSVYNALLPPNLPVTSNLPPVAAAPQTSDASVTSTAPDAPKMTRPIVHDGLTDEEEEPKDINRWWDWVKGKLDAIKWWAHDRVEEQKDETQTRP